MSGIDLQRLLELGNGVLKPLLAREGGGQQIVIARASGRDGVCFSPRGSGAIRVAKSRQVYAAVVPERGGGRQIRNSLRAFEKSQGFLDLGRRRVSQEILPPCHASRAVEKPQALLDLARRRRVRQA